MSHNSCIYLIFTNRYLQLLSGCKMREYFLMNALEIYYKYYGNNTTLIITNNCASVK